MMLFNPTPNVITRTIRVPLYYAGIRGNAKVKLQDGQGAPITVDSAGNVDLTVTIPAEGYSWLTFSDR